MKKKNKKKKKNFTSFCRKTENLQVVVPECPLVQQVITVIIAALSPDSSLVLRKL